MSYAPEFCWYLERVGIRELPHYILQNSKKEIRIGRAKGNDKILKNSLPVSRNHLIFIRHGNPDDWESIRWSLKDLGGTNGTYVNQVKVASNEPMVLNAEELIGIGCPDQSSKVLDEAGSATFVYQLKPPLAFNQNQIGEDDGSDADRDTPPPSVTVAEKEKCSGRIVSASSNQLDDEVGCSASHPSTSSLAQDNTVRTSPQRGKRTKRKERISSVSEDDVRQNKKIGGGKRRRICHLIDSSEDEGERGRMDGTIGSEGPSRINLERILKGVRKKKLRIEMKNLRLPSRAVAAKLRQRMMLRNDNLELEYDVQKWRSVSTQEYRKISRDWQGLAADNSQGTPLLAVLEDSDGRSVAVSSSEDEVSPAPPPAAEEEMEDLLDSPDMDSVGVSGGNKRKYSRSRVKDGEESVLPVICRVSSDASKATLNLQRDSNKPNSGPTKSGQKVAGDCSSQSSAKEPDSKQDSHVSICPSPEDGQYEDISSDEDIKKELQLVGVENIRKSMRSPEDSLSSKSSSPDLRDKFKRKTRLTPIPQERYWSSSPDMLEAMGSRPQSPGPGIQITVDYPPLVNTGRAQSDDMEDEEDMFQPLPAPTEDRVETLIIKEEVMPGPGGVQMKLEEEAMSIKLEDARGAACYPYYNDDDDVIVIDDSEAEDEYLQQSQSFLELPESENERSEMDSDSDIEIVENYIKAEEESEVSGVEDSDDEEIFNSSQTGLFHKIKIKHNVDIKTKIKSEPLSQSMGEAQSQSLLGSQDMDDLLVEDILDTLGPLADHDLVTAAYRRDKELGGTETSPDNIFRLAREEMEVRLVRNTMEKFGCSKGMVRECLAEMRGQDDEIFIEQIDVGRLEKHVHKNILVEEFNRKPEYDIDLVRRIVNDKEDEGQLNMSAVQQEYSRMKRIEEMRKSYEERATQELESKQKKSKEQEKILFDDGSDMETDEPRARPGTPVVDVSDVDDESSRSVLDTDTDHVEMFDGGDVGSPADANVVEISNRDVGSLADNDLVEISNKGDVASPADADHVEISDGEDASGGHNEGISVDNTAEAARTGVKKAPVADSVKNTGTSVEASLGFIFNTSSSHAKKAPAVDMVNSSTGVRKASAGAREDNFVDDLLDEDDEEERKKYKSEDKNNLAKPPSKQDIVKEKIVPAKVENQKPEPSRFTGPILMDALAQPPRRAFNRSISMKTLEPMLFKAGSLDPTRIKKREAVPKYTGMFVKEAPRTDKANKTIPTSEVLRQRLKEISVKEKRVETTRPKSSVPPTVVMKSSEPKHRRMLQDLTEEATIKPVPRKYNNHQRHTSGDTNRVVDKKEAPRPASIFSRRNTEPEKRPQSAVGETAECPVRRNSECEPSVLSCSSSSARTTVERQWNAGGGFLEAEALTDRKAKKIEKMEKTKEGYIIKKMSMANVDYNVLSQDLSKKSVQPRFLKYSTGTGAPKPNQGKKKKTLVWADDPSVKKKSGGILTQYKEIPADNIGKKVNNIKDIMEPTKESKLRSISSDDIIKIMVNWKPCWIKERKMVGGRNYPTIEGPYIASPLPAKFNNYDDYRRLFIPLMLHEMWSTICREVDEKEDRGAEDIVPVMIQEDYAEKDKRFRTFHCCSILTETESRRDPGQNGTFAIVRLSYLIDQTRMKNIRDAFGFVKEIEKKRLVDCRLSESELKQKDLILARKKNPAEATYWVKYVIITKMGLCDKKREWDGGAVDIPLGPLCFDKPVIVKFLMRIKPELRKLHAMLDLPKSKLFNSIVKTDLGTLTVRPGSSNLHASIKDLPQFKMLNELQRKVVVGVSRACLEDQENKICLVQGPPGTGKSSTIVGIILQLISARLGCLENGEVSKHRVPRILLCAPSNAAVDSIALKLKDVLESLPQSKQFSFMRLGVSKSMHPEVAKHSFEAIIQRMVTADARQMNSVTTYECDEQSKQQKANRLYEEKVRAEKEGNKDMADKLERQYKEVMREKEKIRSILNKPLDRKQRQQLEHQATGRLMADVDVILSTLSSSLTHVMENYFVKGAVGRRDQENYRDISVCILDEASQCVEPEALIPLKLKLNKLVMVGDPEQLPATVISNMAKNCNYRQSLFGRLFGLYTAGLSSDKENLKGPVLSLTTQYRMHQEINIWPSRYFYGGTLTPGDQKRDSVMAPYTILNLASRETIDKGAISNEGECGLAVQVVEAFRRMTGSSKLTIGIITFYAKQKANISLELQNRRIHRVDVNTVDGYQGSERDIIVLSCVRSGGDSIGFLGDKERLNVALTRAKLALVLIGNLDTLKVSDMWRELIADGFSRKVVYNMADNPALDTILRRNRK